MGIISSIGSALSSAVKKVTKVVKSFAPGGTTPSQAISSAFGGGGSTSKTSSSTGGGGSSSGGGGKMSVKSPFDAPDNALTRKLAGQPQGQGMSVKKEPQLLGAGGTASSLLGIGDVVSIKSPKEFVSSYWQNIKTSSNMDALALSLGVTGIVKGLFGGILGGGTGATTQATITGTGTQTIGKIGTKGVLPELAGTQGVGLLQSIKHLATWQTAIKSAVSLAGVDVLVTWFGADNRASTSSYYTNLVRDRFNRGDVSRGDAISRLNELEISHKQAKSFIDYSTMLNPVLWAFRGFFMDGMTEQEQNMADNRDFVMNTQETQSEQFLRTAEEKQIQFLENQKLILEAQLDAEERFADAQRERNDDKMAEAKEVAQFYEAIRKRNAGEELTADEIDLLLRWGVSPEISMADWDAYGQSSLNFGLI